MKKTFKSLIPAIMAAFLVFSCHPGGNKEFRISPLFSDHMVLQQLDTVPFWGISLPEKKITVTASWGAKAETTAGRNGYWKAALPTPTAGGPYEVSIYTKDTTVLLHDVMTGEVWLASGQSNMEMPLKGWFPDAPIQNSEEEIVNSGYPAIRMFTVKRAIALQPADELTGLWVVSSPATSGDFSATAYFFARRLYDELRVPVGIIHSSWGGTPVEAWTSKEKLLKLGEFTRELEALNEENIAKYKAFLSQFPSVDIPEDEEGWKVLDLRDIAYSQPEYPDTLWNMVTLPGMVEDFEKKNVDGAFWFRKEIFLSDPFSRYKFIITGGVDDMDDTYINGKKIGMTHCWNCPREYAIPEGLLQKGRNVISIRVIDTGGGGGFQGRMYLISDSGEEIPVDGEWRYRHIAEISEGSFILYHVKPALYEKRPAGIIPLKVTANSSAVLYNGMIHPLLPYTIKGAIWYQGESNVGFAGQYLKVFAGMIEDWRQRWNRDFPFYFVQIAPFNYGNGLSPALRDAQRKSLTVPHTGMVVTLDIGDSNNIHPANKQDVGSRLAGLALANEYGKDIVASGPLYQSSEIAGNRILLTFSSAGRGLSANGGTLTGFEIAGADKGFVPAAAVISGDKVEVFADKVQKPLYVRYAWTDTSTASLFNKEGLPASPFTTIK